MNGPETHRIVGRRLFTDGIEREVYEDDSGRQYVLGPTGRRCWGCSCYWPMSRPWLKSVRNYWRLEPNHPWSG
jgi:hypothetical protein